MIFLNEKHLAIVIVDFENTVCTLVEFNIQRILKPLFEYTHAHKWKIEHIKVIDMQVSLSQYHIAQVHTEDKYKMFMFINYIDCVKLKNILVVYTYITRIYYL